MRRIFISGLIAGLALLASACANAPSYSPALKENGPGYSHVQIEQNRFLVNYRAPGAADRQQVENFALLRAAELTLEQGHSWFIVDRRSIDEAAPLSGPRVGVSLGGFNFGRRSSVGAGVGVSIPIGEGSGPRAQSASLEVRMGDGPKPDDPNAYEALSVSRSLRAQMQASQ